MIIKAAMGSLCTAPRNEKHSQKFPPTDLSELLIEAEKVSESHIISNDTFNQQAGLPTPWLSEFQLHLASHDQKTGISWRARLLEFILEVIGLLHKIYFYSS